MKKLSLKQQADIAALKYAIQKVRKGGRVKLLLVTPANNRAEKRAK